MRSRLAITAAAVTAMIAPRRIARDVDRLEQVVTQVIQQSRDSSRPGGAGDRGGTCDLGQVVRRRMAFWSILASGQGRRATVAVPDVAQPVGVSEGELQVCPVVAIVAG